MTPTFKVLALAAGIAAGISSWALAQVKPEDAIRARQAIMRVIALNVGPIAAGIARDRMPYEQSVIVTNSTRLQTLWQAGPDKFVVRGTDEPVPGASPARFPGAKPGDWNDHDKFKSAYDNADRAITKLAQVARSRDEQFVRAAVGEAGKACKGRHEDFRAK